MYNIFVYVLKCVRKFKNPRKNRGPQISIFNIYQRRKKKIKGTQWKRFATSAVQDKRIKIYILLLIEKENI